jgi:hypothetical protein
MGKQAGVTGHIFQHGRQWSQGGGTHWIYDCYRRGLPGILLLGDLTAKIQKETVE